MAALLVGFALRLYHLGGESFWYDETVSVYLAGLEPDRMLAHTAGDIHPPGYYLLLHLWSWFTQPALFHGLEYLNAWFSVFMGMLILALLHPIARRLFDARVALVAVWLAAINPFQIWYSQEVRMYTLGAALGLLCTYATLRWFKSVPATGISRVGLAWLGVYALTAAAGLYTLYYFLFLLAGINIIALLLWQSQRRGFKEWIAAQGVVLLFYLPWLPVLWRQATDPPVPPWRVLWRSAGDAAAAITEALAALLIGQSPPQESWWPWALVAIGVVVVYCLLWWTDSRSRTSYVTLSYLIPLTAIFAPLLLIFFVTWLITPLYHVRYLFTFAPLFAVVAAVAVVGLSRRSRALGAVLALVIIVASLAGLQEFWFNPLYRADDHRSAVARLAASWRPGDVILANAGWVYPILEVYWPRTTSSQLTALPPALSQRVRLVDVANGEVAPVAARVDDSPPTVTVVRSGSVDGDATLGWGDPASDFFPMSASETHTGLEHLADEYGRLWHYRLYDTVSDPRGVIREWLEQNGQLVLDDAIAGRDFARLQLFDMGKAGAWAQRAEPLATFGEALRLLDLRAPLTLTAGATLYAALRWEALDGLSQEPVPLSMSLRLYDDAGNLLAQADAPPDLPTDRWSAGLQTTQVMALPIPITTSPTTATLELVVYRQNDGSPLMLAEDAQTIFGQRRILQRVSIAPHQE